MANQPPTPPPVQPQFQIGSPPPRLPSPPPLKPAPMNPVTLTLILCGVALFVTFIALVSISSDKEARAKEQAQIQVQTQGTYNAESKPQYVKAQANIFNGSRIYTKAYDGTMVYNFRVVDAVYNGDRRYILVEYPDGSMEVKLRVVATNENMWTDNN